MGHLLDPATEIEFPATLFEDGGAVTCLGVGVRIKKVVMVNIKAYSIGLYVNASEGQAALASFASTPASSLAKSEAYYTAIMGLTRKYIHLIFARNVPRSYVVDALTSVSGVSKPVVAEFTSILGAGVGQEMAKGHSITLGALGDILAIFVDGTAIGELKDAALPSAVFSMFLGPKPVAPAAKAAFANGLASLMAIAAA